MRTIKKFKYICLAVLSGLAIQGCTEGDKFDYDQNYAYITGTEDTPVQSFTVEETPATYAVTASTTAKVDKDTKVDFVLDEGAVAAYNEKHNTTYEAVPASAVEIDNPEAVIKAGKASSSSVNIKVVSTDNLVEGKTYVIPLTMQSADGLAVLESSKTIFLRLARKVHFKALDISYSEMYSNYIIPENLQQPLNQFTFEVKCYSREWHHIARMCALNVNKTCMLRFGELGTDVNQLQWVSPGGNVLSNTRFETDRWYNISLTYDGKTYIMYVDGVKDNELVVPSAVTDLKMLSLEIGMSWTTYPGSQYFNGKIAEVRVWNRALSAAEIKMGLGAVDPASNGLVAYWKMNEGEGHIFHDATGHGYDIDWSKSQREKVDGQGRVPTPEAANYVRWDASENNTYIQ